MKTCKHTVNTASDTVPMMNAFELLYLSKNGGFDPCCVNDDNHFGRAMEYCEPRILKRGL